MDGKALNTNVPESGTINMNVFNAPGTVRP
jgi:hypothetical protein